MKNQVGSILAAMIIAFVLGACESSSSETAPFHAISDDPVVVTGQATCSFSNAGVDPEGGAGFLVTCEHDMSDPRVSGTEIHDRFRFYNGGETGDVWVAEEATITNAEGTWRGTAQAADDGLPCGEAHYVGEGAYEGLEYHYYFGHFADDEDDWVVIRGWIFADGQQPRVPPPRAREVHSQRAGG